jgi:hypothetical protein
MARRQAQQLFELQLHTKEKSCIKRSKTVQRRRLTMLAATSHHYCDSCGKTGVLGPTSRQQQLLTCNCGLEPLEPPKRQSLNGTHHNLYLVNAISSYIIIYAYSAKSQQPQLTCRLTAFMHVDALVEEHGGPLLLTTWRFLLLTVIMDS